MNDVNGSVALATAHKLRSAAAAILSDAGMQSDPRLADSLMYEAGEISKRADSIEEQVKPTIEEPTEFGSVVHASDAEGRTFNAVRVYEGAKKPWNSGTAWYGWWELKDPEVLRVGVGEAADETAYCSNGLNGEDCALAYGHASPFPRVHPGNDRWHVTATGKAWPAADDELSGDVGPQPLAEWESDLLNFQYRRDTAAAVLMAMDVDQCLIDAVVNAKPDAR